MARAAKFTDGARATLSQERISAALDAIYRVEEMGSVGELAKRLVI